MLLDRRAHRPHPARDGEDQSPDRHYGASDDGVARRIDLGQPTFGASACHASRGTPPAFRRGALQRGYEEIFDAARRAVSAGTLWTEIEKGSGTGVMEYWSVGDRNPLLHLCNNRPDTERGAIHVKLQNNSL